jgi:hypothetical protein
MYTIDTVWFLVTTFKAYGGERSTDAMGHPCGASRAGQRRSVQPLHCWALGGRVAPLDY